VTDHDLALVERLRAGTTSEVVEAEEPGAVAAALVDAGGREVSAEEAETWASEAQALRALADDVLAAEALLARAHAAEHARRAAAAGAAVGEEPPTEPPTAEPPAAPAGEEDDEDGPAADRAAVRFSLVVLGIAQVGGLAVYAEDRLVIAALAPALGIAGVVAVVLAHRPRRRAQVPARAPEPDLPPARSGHGDGTQDDRSHDEDGGGEAVGGAAGDVPTGPVVRAAEAHLRRRHAAWKVAWWERELPPADVRGWTAPPGDDQPPATLVVLDPDRAVPDPVVATMTAAVPATVRVVVVRARRA